MTTARPTNAPEILIVAAEPSSALYARRLLEYWRETGQEFHAFGVGSREMEALGFEAIGRTEEMAVMGFVEVVKHYPLIRSVFHKLVDEAERRRPKAVLLLDYPGFNLRIAKKFKKLGLPVIYYISPTVWAWKKSRIKTIQKYVDKMLVLLPFEKDFYKQNGVEVEFVGHPILDEIRPELFDKKEIAIARSRYGVTPDDIWVGLMPGSREAELQQHMGVQLEVARRMAIENPRLKFALLVAPGFSKQQLQSFLPSYDLQLMIVQDEPFKMLSLVDMVLCKSGTSTLMVGLMGKPMVIMYRVAPITAWIAKLIVRGTKLFGLINLVLGRMVSPEFFQKSANAELLTAEMMKFVRDPAYCNEISKELMTAHDRLGSRGATERVAEVLRPYMRGIR